MIHESLRHVRSFADLCMVTFPFQVSRNDLARFWNILHRINLNGGDSSGDVTLDDLNCSRHGVGWSLSRASKLLSFATGYQRNKFRFSFPSNIEVVNVWGRYPLETKELVELFNPTSPAQFTGRGRTRAAAARPSARRVAPAAIPAMPRPVATVASNADSRYIPLNNADYDGNDPDQGCSCTDCMNSRRVDPQFIRRWRIRMGANPNTNETNVRTPSFNVGSLMEGFDAFSGLAANVFTSLMLEAAR